VFCTPLETSAGWCEVPAPIDFAEKDREVPGLTPDFVFVLIPAVLDAASADRPGPVVLKLPVSGESDTPGHLMEASKPVRTGPILEAGIHGLHGDDNLPGHHNYCPGEFIMPALLPGIPQNPEEPEEEKNRRQWIAGQVAQCCELHAEWPAIGANDPDAKDAHPGGLAIVSGKNHEIHQQQKQGEAGHNQEVFVRPYYRPVLERSDHECKAHHRDQRYQEVEYQRAVAKTKACLFKRANKRMSRGRIQMGSATLNLSSNRANRPSTPNALGRYTGCLRGYWDSTACRLVFLLFCRFALGGQAGDGVPGLAWAITAWRGAPAATGRGSFAAFWTELRPVAKLITAIRTEFRHVSLFLDPSPLRKLHRRKYDSSARE